MSLRPPQDHSRPYSQKWLLHNMMNCLTPISIFRGALRSVAALTLVSSFVVLPAPYQDVEAAQSCAFRGNTAAMRRGNPEAGPPLPTTPFDITSIKTPPLDNRDKYVAYMKAWRGVDEIMSIEHFNRYERLIGNRDISATKEKRAFLLAPREEFARIKIAAKVYAHAVRSIGCGVTISGPHLVGRMTSEIDVKPGEKVLEIGTGSGYQSSFLSYLTDKVFTIEIIPPLAVVTDRIYKFLSRGKFPEFRNVTRKTADGYFGWEEHAPFDKIIVTAGIDHIPPPLLKQLKVGGIMVIPVGPPGAQALLKVTKERTPSGKLRIVRHDIYAARPSRAGGRKVSTVIFVPFTKYDDKGKTIARWGKK